MNAPLPNTALVVALSNIGDAVMSTAVLEGLHAHDPAMRIDVVADPRSSELFRHCPYIEQLFHREKQAGFSASARLLWRLRRKRYRVVVDLRTDGLAYLLRAGQRLTKWQGRTEGRHAVERHMAVVRPYLGNVDIPDTKVWLTPALEQRARELIGPLAGARWLALGPGANWPGKIWPAASFAALVEALRAQFAGVVVIGGDADRARAAQLVARLRAPAVDLTGKTTLLEAAAVLGHAGAFVGNDSGLGHLAAAVGTPTMTVFGPGDPERYHPWGGRAAWLASSDRAIESLDPARVAAALRSHLERLSRTA